MRSLAVYLTLLVLLAVSIAAGFIASDWPRWCRWLGWCAANWPPSR
jgi:protein-S-isoprenylcysteine O-methyltransferase Ste14